MNKKMCKPGGMCGTICSKCGRPQEYIEDFGCPEITKINYGNPYDPYDAVWKDEDRFNNAMFDIGAPCICKTKPQRAGVWVAATENGARFKCTKCGDYIEFSSIFPGGIFSPGSHEDESPFNDNFARLKAARNILNSIIQELEQGQDDEKP